MTIIAYWTMQWNRNCIKIGERWTVDEVKGFAKAEVNGIYI